MIPTLKYAGEKFLSFLVNTLQKVTLLATLVSVAVCLVLFFMCFFTGHPEYSLLSLAGMLCFVHVNKQY